MCPFKPIALPLVDSSSLDQPEIVQAVKTIENQPAKWLPLILKDRCTACGDCLDVCGPSCLILGLGPVTLSQPELCVSAEDCLKVCPDEAIRMAWVVASGEHAVGRWRNTPETLIFNKRGCSQKPDPLVGQLRLSGDKS